MSRVRGGFASVRRPALARRGGVLVWLIGGLLFIGAAGTLAWMLLLPGAVQARFAAATGSALQVRGLAGDPFAGEATVAGWTLRASTERDAAILARGGAASVRAPGWRDALSSQAGETVVIERLDLVVNEAVLAPDDAGRWALLSIAAAAGLPYERGGAVGADAPRVRIKRLRLQVETIVIRNSPGGRPIPVRINWSGEFTDLDHLRPVVTALLAAARGAG